jgi:hypothetical protein
MDRETCLLVLIFRVSAGTSFNWTHLHGLDAQAALNGAVAVGIPVDAGGRKVWASMEVKSLKEASAKPIAPAAP